MDFILINYKYKDLSIELLDSILKKLKFIKLITKKKISKYRYKAIIIITNTIISLSTYKRYNLE